MSRVASVTGVLAVLVVLAGCFVPVPAGVGPATASAVDADDATAPAVEIETAGFEPSYDPRAVLDRVEALRGIDAVGRIVLHEYDDRNESVPDVEDTFGAIRPAGSKALGLYSNASSRSKLPLGYTVQRGNVTHIHLMNATDLRAHGVAQDVVLAHEFTHAIQFQHGIITPSREEFREDFGRWTTDARLVSTALYEGDAMVVTAEYYEATRDEPFDIERHNETLSRAIWPYSLGGTPYYYGYRYHRAVADSPAERTELIRDPPATSRQLLHPDEGEGAAMGAGERFDGSPPEWVAGSDALRTDHVDRIGELAIRHTFRVNGLSFDRASSAAAGWVDDTMYYLRTDDGTRAVVWTVEWADDAEAREFQKAWRALLDSRNATEKEGLTLVPASDDAPASAYAVDRDGSTVRIIWSLDADAVRSVDERAP